ncbi:hypothetical protein DFH29DRAFT_970837 [Suillus ampliporus]|nr:hypothetical protein DFH29DRAFT_970837 [Suillus ampliporus]
MAIAMYETPDDRYTPGDITPSWNSWQHVPDVHTFKTDMTLLERCAFWLNVSAYSAQ